MTQAMTRFTKISEIMNACVVLSQTTGPTVRKVLAAGQLNTVQKGACKNDVCTEADLRVQRTI